MSERFSSVDQRQLIDQVTPDTPQQVRLSRKRARRLREFVCAHLPENVDVEVVITPHISTAAVLPADIDSILGADATELDRAQAERLLTGVDADYLVLVTGNEAPLDRIPLNDQLTADHAHQFGLAFHELLHILKTAIVTIGRLLEEEIDPQYHEPVHDLINIIEDGAIEHEAVHGETFSDNAGIRLELTRRIHSMTPEDIRDGQQVEFTFWDAVTSSLYDATIYPTGMTECLLDPDDDRIGFKAEADRNAFEAVQDDLKRLAVDALSISGNASGDGIHEHGKYASIRRARRVIETWKTAIQPVLERQQAGLQERSDEAKLGGEPDSGEQDDDELQAQRDDSASGSDDESRSDLGEDGSPSDNASAGGTPEKGDHRPESDQGDLHPSEVTVERQATAIPYQDIFEQPAVTADPDVGDLSELEKIDSLGGVETAISEGRPDSDFDVPDVEGGSTGDESIDSGTAGSQEAEDSPVDELPTQTQVLAEAIERTRTREPGGSASSGDVRAGDGMDAEQPGSDGAPSSGDQLSLDEFDSESTAGRFDEESEGSEVSEANSSAQHDAADDGTNSGSLKTASSDTDSGGPSPEAESEPVGPAHARSHGKAPDEEQASYEDALDTDRRTAHEEAAREGIDRTALEQELAELGRTIERERGQVEEVEGAGRENSGGGSGGGPGNLDDIDIVPVAAELVPAAEWTAIENGAHQVAGTLEKELRLERQQGERTGLTAGTYDTRAGHRLAMGDPRVLKTRTPGREKRYTLVLVLDRSGSMREGSPPKIEVATQALARFAVATEGLGIEVAVIDFIHGTTRLVKPFSVETRHVQATLLNTSCGGGTPLADAIGLARQLVSARRDEPLVITVTDDEPRSVEAVIEQLRESAAPVCSLTIATDCDRGSLSPDASRLAPYYERQAAVYSPNRLDDRLDQFASLLAGL